MKFKRLIALVLSFVMIAASAVSTVTVSAASEQRVQFEEDFEKTKLASSGASAEKGGLVEYVKDPDYGTSLHLKSGSEAGQGVKYTASIGKFDRSGVLSFSVKFTSSVDWTSFYFGSSINTYISTGGLGVHLGSSTPSYAKLSANEWHDIEIHFDVPANSMDLYLDYERVASGIKFRNAVAFNQFTVNVDKKDNDFYLDNIYFTYSDSTKGASKSTTTTDTSKEEVKQEEKPAEPEKVMYQAQEGETVTVAKADTHIGFNSGKNAAQGMAGTVAVTKDNATPANEKIGFFKFDAPQVPDGKKAYLQLYLKTVSYASVPFGVYATETNWDETLHYADDYIKIIDSVGSVNFNDYSVNSWVKIDVTDYVKANAGKEISLSLRGKNATGNSTVEFDSIQSVCQPHILVCDPVAELEIKAPEDKDAAMEAPVANKLSIAELSNVTSLKEINMYVIGSDKADTTLYKDVYGDFADKLAKATGAKVNYINKGYAGLAAGEAAELYSKLAEEQVADLIVADFADFSESQATEIANKWRGINRNMEFVFVADEGSFNVPGSITLPRAKLLGAEVTDAKGGAAKDYVAEPKTKWDIKKKASREVVDLLDFNDYDGNNVKNKFLYENADYYFNAEDDAFLGGKYLRIKKDTARGSINTKYFATTVGGNLRFDYQICLFNPDTSITIDMYPTARDSFKMDSMAIGNMQLTAGLKSIYTFDLNTWYNIAVLYDMHTNKYDVLVNGEVVATDISTQMTMGNICSYEFNVNSGSVGDFGLDNMRISFYNDAEKPVEKVEAVEDDGPVIVFASDFENMGQGVIEKGSSGHVDYVKEDGNTFIRAIRTGGNGSCSTIYKFATSKGDVYLDLDFRLGDLSGATKLMYIMNGGNFAVPIYFSTDKMCLNISASERPVIKDGLEANVWYHLTVRTDLANGKYTAFIDGEDCGTYELQGGAQQFDGIRVSISAGDASTYDVDNIKVERQNEIKLAPGQKSYNKAGGYDPTNTEAPANNAWIEKYRRNPSGEIYEAEDMKLDGYVVYKDLNFHNNYGIKVGQTGCGIAEFTYTGESGYKQIDYGYLEEYGEEDSFFYLYQNGELIDWIICQNDEVGRYNRTAKEWWYVEKGDKFMIRGSYGLEPSMLDYVEFNDGIKREFSTGDLVGEANRAQGYRLSSGWDVVDGKGGWASSGLVLRDTSATDSLNLERRLPEFYEPFLFEFQYTPYAQNKFDMLIGNMTARKNEYAIKITVDGGDLIMGGKRYEDVINENGDTFFRFDVDTITGTYTAVANSVLIAENIPFDNKIDSFSVFRFVTDKETKSYFKAYPFAIKAGYVMLEDFRCESDANIELYNWNVEGRTTTAKDNAENIDPWHRVITSGTTISRSFRPQTGVITFETQIIFKSKKDGSRVAIGNSEGGEIALFTKDGDIWYDAGNGNTGVIWENFMKDVWYEYKLEINMTNHKCDFYVNSFQKISADITADMTKADFVRISSDEASGDFWVDDIVVFNGTYNDDNEVPEPVLPEGYGDYNLVMQTCDMWREGTHFGYDCLHPWASRTPFLGYLEEGDPEVSDWQTKWMVEHGINVFSPCWYMPNDANSAPKNPRNGYSLDQGFMNSKYQDKIKFSIKLTYAGVTSGKENWLKYYVAYWIEHYFKHPSYWVVDNKPVIMCFNTSEFQSAFGSNNAAVLEEARQMCRDAGFDGAYFVACNGGTRAQGWDYAYKYAWNNIADGYAGAISEATKTLNDSGMAPYIFTMSQGWGHEAWGREGRKINMTLKDWKATLQWGKNVFMPSMDQNDELLSKTMTFGNWNEYCEGHTLAPSNLTGFGYLDMIREVFYPDAGPHEDIKPDKKFDQMSAMLW